jgi:hypothetical protein
MPVWFFIIDLNMSFTTNMTVEKNSFDISFLHENSFIQMYFSFYKEKCRRHRLILPKKL